MSFFKNLSGNGTISFSQRLLNYNSSGADYVMLSLAAGDYNNDNRVDIAIGNNATSLPFLLNSNSFPGSFTFGLLDYGYTFSHSYSHISAVDFDRDGKTDILTEDTYYQNLTTNQGAIYFTQPIYLTTRNFATPDDMDGDGKPDIVKGLARAGFTVTKNISTPGNINFAASVKYKTLENPYALSTGDLEGDGKPEIITVNRNSNSISIFKNKIGSLLQFCPPVANTTITTNLSGTNYQWQMNSGNGFTNISNGSNFSNTNTAAISLINVPSAWYGRKFRCLTNGNPGYVYTIQFTNSWTGNADSSWENPLNWSCGTVPDINTDVEIKSGNIIVNSNVSIRSLSINPAVILTVNAGYNLTVVH